jgi:hypothetical protein
MAPLMPARVLHGPSFSRSRANTARGCFTQKNRPCPDAERSPRPIGSSL